MARRGACLIDVDPLVILGRVGERVDARLRDLEPVGRSQVGTAEVAEIGQPVGARSLVDTRVVATEPRQSSGYAADAEHAEDAARDRRGADTEPAATAPDSMLPSSGPEE